uniref:Ig-like domain-containing protein n=1 Tax=Mastacembelus armatus TaxID=205130 RepID=A0A3Q3RZ41_9TELE
VDMLTCYFWMVCIASNLPFTAQPCCGLIIISRSVSPTYAAVGDSVTLKCYFIPAAEDLGELDIEWSIKPSDAHGEETRIIWNAGNHMYYGYDPLRGRVQFASPNPASGNASIRITDLRATDQNTYQCKVKKLPKISMTKMDLNVMERPTASECNLEGAVDLGHNVVLRCRSKQGSPPMWYNWSKDSSDKMLPNDACINSVRGDLYLTVTRDVLGTYICTAQNIVGMDTCSLTLKFNLAVRVRIAVAAAATVLIPIISIIMIISIIITIIVCCCYRINTVQQIAIEIVKDEIQNTLECAPETPAEQKADSPPEDSPGCVPETVIHQTLEGLAEILADAMAESPHEDSPGCAPESVIHHTLECVAERLAQQMADSPPEDSPGCVPEPIVRVQNTLECVPENPAEKTAEDICYNSI